MKQKPPVMKVLKRLSDLIRLSLLSINGLILSLVGGFLEWYFCEDQKVKFDEVKMRIEKQLSGGFFKKTPYKAKV